MQRNAAALHCYFTSTFYKSVVVPRRYKMALLKVLSVIVVFGFVSAKPNVGDSFSLYKVTVNSVEQRKVVNQLKNKLNLDVWVHPRLEKPGQILVSHHQKKVFENEFSASGIKYHMIVDDVNELYEKERIRLAEAARMNSNITKTGTMNLAGMYTLDEVDFLLDTIEQFYKDQATVETLFNSAENKPIRYVKISSSKFTDSSKPIIFIQSLVNGRDWISLRATLKSISKLLFNITEQDLVDDIDWIILPVVNPDGYHYSTTNTRHWVKNRRTNGDGCFGVNIDRNFDVGFGDTSSGNGCSNDYHGAYVFSERESQTVRNIAVRYQPRIRMFLDFQSFGSQILYGYGNGTYFEDKLMLHYLAAQMANAMNDQETNKNKDYTVGNVVDILEDGESGIAIDHMKIEGNIPFSYTIKMPSYGVDEVLDDGFLIDPQYFNEVMDETWEGIKVAARFVRDLYKK
ncbi:carboxypeptidase B-like [Aphomia sociella]